MGIITMILVGLVAGLLARGIMPGRDPMGWVATIVLGIVGSFLGGFLLNFLARDGGSTADFRPSGIVGSVIGALVVLALYHITRRRAA
jgi:uncharacterized membrane protein YeaQ/YmgE (transglycosylase-associated protein family)